MKVNGIYTATVAVAIIVILVSSAYSMVSAVQTNEIRDYGRNIVETKWRWQNTRHILSATVSDALADTGFNNGCAYDPVLDATMNAYFTDALNKMGNKCISRITNINGDATNTEVTFTLECFDDSTESSIEYNRTNIVVKKEVRYDTSAGPGVCEIDVRDRDTDKCEVDEIVSLSAFNMCDG